jgi:PPE-repeat protein
MRRGIELAAASRAGLERLANEPARAREALAPITQATGRAAIDALGTAPAQGAELLLAAMASARGAADAFGIAAGAAPAAHVGQLQLAAGHADAAADLVESFAYASTHGWSIEQLATGAGTHLGQAIDAAAPVRIEAPRELRAWGSR